MSVEGIFINVAVVFGCFQTVFAFHKCMKINSVLVPHVYMLQDMSTSHLGLLVQYCELADEGRKVTF